jgi:hypothetical protein
MSKKIILIIVGVLILLVLSSSIAIKYRPNIFVIPAASKIIDQTKSASTEIILFYGNGCPHCALVEKFLIDNKVAEKIAIAQKEVYSDQVNAALLGDKAHACGLDTNSIGVPFLWDGPTGKCLVGDQDIINYFKQKINQ